MLDHEYLQHQNISKDFLKSLKGYIRDMFFQKEFIVGSATIPRQLVRQTLSELTPYAVEHTFLRFDEYSREKPLRNPKTYIQTILYNSVADRVSHVLRK